MQCRELSLKSPGIIYLLKGFWEGLRIKGRGLYPRGIITGMEKAVRNKLELC